MRENRAARIHGSTPLDPVKTARNRAMGKGTKDAVLGKGDSALENSPDWIPMMSN